MSFEHPKSSHLTACFTKHFSAYLTPSHHSVPRLHRRHPLHDRCLESGVPPCATSLEGRQSGYLAETLPHTIPSPAATGSPPNVPSLNSLVLPGPSPPGCCGRPAPRRDTVGGQSCAFKPITPQDGAVCYNVGGSKGHQHHACPDPTYQRSVTHERCLHKWSVAHHV